MDLQNLVDGVYRTESRRVLATLIRLLGDFDLAEEALQDAFAAAVEQWRREGVPANPRAWLVSTGRFKAIDSLRRRKRFDATLEQFARRWDDSDPFERIDEDPLARDDQLRLIFTCCHPALSHDSQVALTLREVCGLRTEEIASGFLTSATTIAQRIVRGKAKIREAGIPYQVPAIAELPERLESVLSVVYLVFNEGYSASSGEALIRADLAGEALRLGRLLLELLPDPEIRGLVALMLLQDSRRVARTAPNGDLILMQDQDRRLWDREKIAEGERLVAAALASPPVGSYTLQAAIALTHAVAPTAAETDWRQIVGWYDLLLQASPSPVIELNRAVAVAMSEGFERGLELIDAILARGFLGNYHLAHAARADLCRRLGRIPEARSAYEHALALTRQQPEQRFLQQRLVELG